MGAIGYNTIVWGMDNDPSLPDNLNILFAQFETTDNRAAQRWALPPTNQAFQLIVGRVPICFKSTTIMPMPTKPNPAYINDYHPVALTHEMLGVAWNKSHQVMPPNQIGPIRKTCL